MLLKLCGLLLDNKARPCVVNICSVRAFFVLSLYKERREEDGSMSSVSAIWDKICARPAVVPTISEIRAEHVVTPLGGVSPIIPQKHYFAIVVDELFLANSRQWHQEFDPMVLAITEFIHGKEKVILPFIVGPKLLGDKGTLVPQGMIYRGTRVAGVHPFRGGRIVSSMVLCQLRRQDYARRLMKFVEGVAGAVPFSADLSTYSRYAGSLLDGIDTLLGLEETTPLVGIRQEFDHDLGTPVRSAYYVIVDGSESDFPVGRLWVHDGSLMIGDSADRLTPFREASYALFSTRGAAELTEIDTLPIAKTAASVIELAASSEDADWERAKAELLVLLRELLSSPDLTLEQAKAYHENIKQQAIEAHQLAKSIGSLGTKSQGIALNELREAVELLKL